MNQQEQQHHEAVEVMDPISRELNVTVDGQPRKYKVVPMETRQIWPVLRLGLPFIGGLNSLFGNAKASAGSPLGGTPGVVQVTDPLAQVIGDDFAGMLRILAENGEAINEMVAIALDEKLAVVGKFQPHDAINAIKAIYTVNKDFFRIHVAPMLNFPQVTESVDGSDATAAEVN